MDSSSVWQNSLEEAQHVLSDFLGNAHNLEMCGQFTNVLLECFQNGGNLFTCGNGGSHCDAMHFAEEWTGRYRKDRKPMGALALGNPSHLSCVSNDFGFEHVFSRELEGLGRKGDLLVGISTSGNSQNVINAVDQAQKMGIKTVGLLGRDGGKLKDKVDTAIIVPAPNTDRIQELHIKIIHIVIESVERRLFPENYR